MRQPRPSLPTVVPPGWFPVQPEPPQTRKGSGGQTGARHDPLGLSRPTNPLHFAVSKPTTSPRFARRPDRNQVRTASPSAGDGSDAKTVQCHRRVVRASEPPATAFSPLRSLRLASLPVHSPRSNHPTRGQNDTELTATLTDPRASANGSVSRASQSRSRRRERESPPKLEPMLPIHELIQEVTEGVMGQGDPLLQINRASVVQVFMEQWLHQFQADAGNFKSIAVRYEVGLRELQQLTANLPTPNELLTAFCCQTLDDLMPHFGAYTPLVRVAAVEIRQSIYADGHVPYFALAKYQARLLDTLHRDRDRREERNEFLSLEIDKVVTIFRHFLDERANGLLSSILHEWHSIAIVRKKNSKKYIAYFSAWFSGSAKTYIPRIFAAWRRETAHAKLAITQQRLNADAIALTELKRQVEEATTQRDMLQLEVHAVRNDRLQAEDHVARLERKIQSASAFLETSARREPFVGQEGHLRVEATSFLPPLVLESLLRGFHGLGFLQQRCHTHEEEITLPSASCGSSLLPQVFAHIVGFQSSSNIESSASSSNAEIANGFVQAFRDIKLRIHAAKALFISTSGGDIDAVDVAAACAGYEVLLQALRIQDEHYVRHPKLFSSRLLENHEVSVVPAALHPLGGRIHMDSDLGLINGARRFSTVNVPMGGLGGVVSSAAAAAASSLARDCDLRGPRKVTSTVAVLLVARLAVAAGALLFPPSDMSAFTHHAYAHRDADTARDVESAPTWGGIASLAHRRCFQVLLDAYDTWNRLAAQLLSAGIVQSRGASLGDPVNSQGSREPPTQSAVVKAVDGGTEPTEAPPVTLRPKLLHQLELLPQSALLAQVSRNTSASGTSPTGRRGSNSNADKLILSGRLRRLTTRDTTTMLSIARELHATVTVMGHRQQEFHTARHQLRDLSQLQWRSACTVASHTSPTSSASPPTPAASLSCVPTGHEDTRKHLFECISIDNPIVDRILRAEAEPLVEFERVCGVLEKRQLAFRQVFYTRPRQRLDTAISLDELWLVVKRLRLPRDVHVLAAPRDDDLGLTTIGASNNYETFFSPEDLAELVLQIANEQFPHLSPLSARVEHFARAHLLPLVEGGASRSALREQMHAPNSELRRALADHAPTLRVIFRRYCAKEREVNNSSKPARGRPAPLAKYLRLADWLAFVQDYHLPRARFPLEAAAAIFRNVQEVDTATPNGDEQLEMIFSEFCEAVAAVALGFFPDPFVKSATKASQFVSRYLPVSPEEAHDHHA